MCMHNVCIINQTKIPDVVRRIRPSENPERDTTIGAQLSGEAFLEAKRRYTAASSRKADQYILGKRKEFDEVRFGEQPLGGRFREGRHDREKTANTGSRYAEGVAQRAAKREGGVQRHGRCERECECCSGVSQEEKVTNTRRTQEERR